LAGSRDSPGQERDLAHDGGDDDIGTLPVACRRSANTRNAKQPCAHSGSTQKPFFEKRSAASAVCAMYATPSRRRHSWYRRTATDLCHTALNTDPSLRRRDGMSLRAVMPASVAGVWTGPRDALRAPYARSSCAHGNRPHQLPVVQDGCVVKVLSRADNARFLQPSAGARPRDAAGFYCHTTRTGHPAGSLRTKSQRLKLVWATHKPLPGTCRVEPTLEHLHPRTTRRGGRETTR
jgi:hypothetical protein